MTQATGDTFQAKNARKCVEMNEEAKSALETSLEQVAASEMVMELIDPPPPVLLPPLSVGRETYF